MARAWISGIGAMALSVGAWAAGCSDDETGGTAGTTSATTGYSTTSSSGMPSSSSVSSGGGQGGAGGTGTGGGTTGTGGATGTGGGTTGSGGGYASCGDCTEAGAGAPANECLSAYDACQADADCVAIYNCVYFGSNGVGPCENTEIGACCTLDCYTEVGALQPAIDLYEAFDGCVYCDVCASLCMFTDYCAVFEPGGNSVCN